MLHPGSGGGHIGAELVSAHLIAVLAAQGEPGFVVGGLQAGGGAPEGADGERGVALLGEALGNAAHPTVHPEHLRQHKHGSPGRAGPGPPGGHHAGIGTLQLDPIRLNGFNHGKGNRS